MSSIKRRCIIDDGPTQQVSQPTGILLMILSYLTYNMNWDSISGVNKKWLTTQRINSYVQWYDEDESRRCCRIITSWWFT
jgi:hypothetical protein